MRRLLAVVHRLNISFATAFNAVLSLPMWLNIAVLGTASWLLYNRFSPHPVDHWPDLPLYVLIATIFTWLDSAANKVVQGLQQRALTQQMDAFNELLVEIHEQNERTERRDAIARKRDAALLTVCERLLDLHTPKTKGGVKHDARRRTRRSPKAQ